MMKRVFALLLALMMVMSMATTAFAETGTNPDENDKPVNTGSITIDKAIAGHDYKVYQVLVLSSWDTEKNFYVYTVAEGWEDFAEESIYLNYDPVSGVTSWNGEVETTESNLIQFAKDALAYAEANGIDGISRDPNVTDKVYFGGLNLGYYLVDSSVGTLCSLDNVMPNTYIEEKNLVPSVDKKVLDFNKDMQESISSRIGKPETYYSVVTAYPGTENLVYHDVMTEGLDLISGSVKVYFTPVANGNLVPEAYYTVNEAPAEHADKAATDNSTVTCAFEVTFDNEYLETLTASKQFTIVYEAALNEKAVIAGDGNVNEASLTYGDEGYTQWNDATIYTYQFGIVKTDVSNHILDGAEFELHYEPVADDLIALVEDEPATGVETGVNYYRPATEAEKAAEGFVSAKIVAGRAVIWGVRSGVDMYLDETRAPNGYNPIAERAHISPLQNADNMPVFEADVYVKGGIEVENLAGTQLPQTGGMGTTLFYVFGGLMVAAAMVLLVTKKRMTAE